MRFERDRKYNITKSFLHCMGISFLFFLLFLFIKLNLLYRKHIMINFFFFLFQKIIPVVLLKDFFLQKFANTN